MQVSRFPGYGLWVMRPEFGRPAWGSGIGDLERFLNGLDRFLGGSDPLIIVSLTTRSERAHTLSLTQGACGGQVSGFRFQG